jgi:S-adenosylmethionine:tRNA ribosyltransferase-isomerase
LLERVINNHRFIGHIKSSKPPKAGGEVILQNGVVLTCEGRDEKMFTFALNENIYEVMHEIGHMPLPPYMNRDDELEDQTRYQTVYAKDEGAVAAPTAGLHFDEALLKKIKAQGVNIAEVTLHVGAGTFLPVRVDDVTNHHMHSEWIDVPQSVCDQIAETKAAGKRVIAVGTTTVRSLETAALSGTLKAYQGDTDIFIYPGFTFKVVDGLITNFHLPESTLLMLVSAFVTKDAMFKAYHEAIAKQYRFFSYGDAMLIL